MPDVESFDVIVIGAGPAGLAAALALRARGVGRLVVLDREDAAGGATRHCGHPPFGLREFRRLLTGPAYSRRLADTARASGVDIRLRHSVVALGAGGSVTAAMPEGKQTLRGDRVILALGAREASRAARLVTGDRPVGVLNTGALQAQIHLHGLVPFRRPVIVGTELVGLSALWTCLGHGIRPQAVVEAQPAPIAAWPLGLFPRLVRVPFHAASEVTDIRGQGRVEAVDVTDAGGRVTTIPCDGLLLTGRFLPETGLLRGGPIALDPGSQGPAVDQWGRCSDPAFFAAGNLLRPIESAGWCHAEGRRLGDVVADDLAGRLPAPVGTVAIRRGAGVKLTLPQRLSLPFATGAPPIQLRLSEARDGTLELRRNGAVVWRRVLRGRLERRVLVPADALAAVGEGDQVEIGFS